MSFLLRITLTAIIIYYIFKWVRRILTGGPKQQPRFRGSDIPPAPPPYDPSNVEDIEYKKVKKKPGKE